MSRLSNLKARVQRLMRTAQDHDSVVVVHARLPKLKTGHTPTR
jgi:hypothetical protein